MINLISTLGVLLLTSLTFSDTGQGKLVINVTGCKNNKGDIKYIVFNQSEGFPSNTIKSYKRGASQIRERKSQIVLDHIPFGSYAISIIHDENANEKMDYNILGMPREGYGASNDANRTLGPPKYEEAKILLDQSSKTIAIHLVYW